MENNQKSTALISLAVCIIIWTVNVFVDFAVTSRPHRITKLLLDGVLLAVWDAAFIAMLTGFRKGKLS